MLRLVSPQIPTDRQLLDVIYNEYHATFKEYDRAMSNKRSSKIYVPVDIPTIAARLNVDPSLVFGRLYYDLERRYGYAQPDGSKVHFFGLKVGADTHCIHVPYLASVLADLREKHKSHVTATTIAVVSLGIAVVSLLISILA
jgi:hypothetical protein